MRSRSAYNVHQWSSKRLSVVPKSSSRCFPRVHLMRDRGLGRCAPRVHSVRNKVLGLGVRVRVRIRVRG